jgi:hypothetical protein
MNVGERFPRFSEHQLEIRDFLNRLLLVKSWEASATGLMSLSSTSNEDCTKGKVSPDPDPAKEKLEYWRFLIYNHITWSKPAPAEKEFQLLFDMGTYHYCRDFEKIATWTRKNAVSSVKMDNLWWSGSNDVEF